MPNVVKFPVERARLPGPMNAKSLEDIEDYVSGLPLTSLPATIEATRGVLARVQTHNTRRTLFYVLAFCWARIAEEGENGVDLRTLRLNLGDSPGDAVG